MNDYKHDIYLSFTGADRDLKNDLYNRLTDAGFENVYDSDTYCKGQFRQDYMEALSSSKVFLMILSDNLRNDPAITERGTLTEVRKELALACELEARNELNIVILCMSEFFKYQSGYKNVKDTIGWLFYTHTRGFSYITGAIEENGLLKDQAYHDIETRARSFIDMRNAGTPVISQAQKLDISTERLPTQENFVGRQMELATVLEAFKNGKQAVVLSGIGGMGKSRLALEIARACKENFFFNCPQIIQINDQSSTQGALFTVASSASYVAELYDSLAYLNEQDKYRRKLKALTDLPENVLLVIDNYNSLSAEHLSELLNNLKCRVLITTRSHIKVDKSTTEYISIDKIDIDSARTLFSSLCGFEVEKGDFASIYDETKGHTITLCIFAKMVKEHSLSISKLKSKMKSLDTMEEEVSERGRYDTIFGHISGLFEVSDFDDTSLKILRSMSILASGTISVFDLMSTLGLKTRNEINALVRTGWLEFIKDEQECLFLHPIIASAMQKILKPSEENVPEMVEYIRAQVIANRDSLTYVSLSTVCETLVYAIDVLSNSSGTLCYALWDEYVKLSHILGDCEENTSATEKIADGITSSTDLAIVEAHSDMLILELHPTRLDILDKYVANLEKDANNYKLIIRSLSTTMFHISSIPALKPKLEKIIEKAIDSAIFACDSLAITTFLIYIFEMSLSKRKAVVKKIRAYIKAQGKNEENGEHLLLSMIFNEYEEFLTKKNGYDNYYSSLIGMINSLNSSFSIMKNLILHPIKNIRRKKIVKKMEELDATDPLKPVFDATMDTFSDDLEFDVFKYLNCIVLLQERLMQKGLTLLSASQMVQNCLGFVKNITLPMLQGEVDRLVGDIDLEAVSINEISRLQVATIVNRATKNRCALEQAELVYNAISRVRPQGHTDVIQAKLSYVDILCEFATTKADLTRAAQLYIDIYCELYGNVDVSKLLSKVASSALSLVSYIKIPIELAKSLFETVAECEQKQGNTYFIALFDYIKYAYSKIYFNEVSENDEIFREIVQILKDLTQNMKGLSERIQCDIHTHICSCALLGSKNGQEPFYNELMQILVNSKPSNKQARRTKNAVITKLVATTKKRQATEPYHMLQATIETIDAYVRNNVYYSSVNEELKNVIYYLQKAVCNDTKIDDVLKIFFDAPKDLLSAKETVKQMMLDSSEEKYYAYQGDKEYLLAIGLVYAMDIAIKSIVSAREGIGERRYNKLKNGKEYLKEIGLLILAKMSQSKFAYPILKSESPKPKLPVRRIPTKKDGEVGRNDPCPCGSGKKYKFCCGNNTNE